MSSEPLSPRIGVMGGTFDPIHFGHLAAAEEVRKGFNLDKVVFVPSARPPHKQGQMITGAHDRLVMTILATVNHPHFDVSAMELERQGLSYTIDTIETFRDQYPPNCRLFFITGADAVSEICTWKDVNRLLDICEFVAVTRPGYNLENLTMIEKHLDNERFSRIHPFPVPELAISSSDIRLRVREERPIKYLLPEAIENYIRKRGLYRGKSMQG